MKPVKRIEDCRCPHKELPDGMTQEEAAAKGWSWMANRGGGGWYCSRHTGRAKKAGDEARAEEEKRNQQATASLKGRQTAKE